ncbi:thioesterase family protein [Nocardioides humilatus]|uniref:Thioesterase family protein n=2 Tax=Nocardioides humilatus TaxID=2607660 RepID=A0A5B1L5V5_9ACTN|nr:thioesterase family protein [Nocardioides humilatus]
MPLAQSLWSTEQIHGVAVSGLLARALERAVGAAGRDDLVPARYHVDLFRPARMEVTTTSAVVVREGPRLMLLDAVVEQSDGVVARATATFLKPSAEADGSVWSATDRPVPPPDDVAPTSGEHHVPFFASEQPWSNNFSEHQNPGRHQTWQTAMPIVVDENCTPFQAAASVADAASLVTNWGAAGVEHINTDISLTLARLPESTSLGLRALDHVAADGLAVGVAEVFDRRGPLGTATVAALVNTRRSVDLAGSGGDKPKGMPGV